MISQKAKESYEFQLKVADLDNTPIGKTMEEMYKNGEIGIYNILAPDGPKGEDIRIVDSCNNGKSMSWTGKWQLAHQSEGIIALYTIKH